MSEAPPVVVIGGGMSGLCAATAAAESGADVVVLEAGPGPGGSMALSGGLIWTARDMEVMRRAIPRGEPALQRLLVNGLDGGWRWLESHGIPLGPEAPCMPGDVGRGRVVALGAPGQRQPFADALAAALRAAGGSIRPDARVTAVERHGDGFTVRVASAQIRAGAVVFAGGGFQNDRSLVRRYVTPYADDLVVRSNRYSDGLAVRSAVPLDLRLSGGMYGFYGHSMPVTNAPVEPRDFIPIAQFYSNHCAIVNDLGLRFTDESLGLVDECNAQAGARQPGGRYHLVFDEDVRRTHVSSGEGLPGIISSQLTDRLDYLTRRGGRVRSAGSLPDLADLLQREVGMPARNLLDTVAAFNAGQTSMAHPARSAPAVPLREPPFYAVTCVPGITYTMGGLAVDDAMRVIGVSGSPVEGLFAAGADAGHVFEDVYGGGLAWALVSGIQAGRAAARQ